MFVYKCKMCGGDLTVPQGSAVATCEFCGSRQTVTSQGESTSTKGGFNKAAEFSSNAEVLLRRAMTFIEDSDWLSAEDYCEKALDYCPESADAYLIKLLAAMHVKQVEELKSCMFPFDKNRSYQKLMCYADEDLKAVLEEYNEQIKKRKLAREEAERRAVRRNVIIAFVAAALLLTLAVLLL